MSRAKLIALTGPALLVCLLAAPGAAHAQNAVDLWPVDEGNQWDFAVAGEGSKTLSIRVVPTGSRWSLIEGIPTLGTRWFYMARTTPRVIAWNAGTRTNRVAFDLGVGRGNTFTMGIDDVAALDGATWEVVTDRGYVPSLVADHTGCIVVRRIRPTDDGIDMIAFAPGIGPVSITWIDADGPHHARLSRAVIAGSERRATQAARGLQGGFTSLDASLLYYFGIQPRDLPGLTDADLQTGLVADPQDARLRRVSLVRTLIWDSTLSYRVDGGGRIDERSSGTWRTGVVVDPVTGRHFEVVHWRDIDDSSWSVYFVGDQIYSIYFEN